MSTPTLAQDIASATRNAFAEWRGTHKDERVFSLALSTIDDALYVSAAINSEESHERILRRRGLLADSREALGCKWRPNEWEYEFVVPTHFESVDARIKGMYDTMHETDWDGFRKSVLDAMVDALVLLRTKAEVPDSPRTKPVVFFAMLYDSEECEALQLRSALAANPHSCISEFLSSLSV